MKLARQHGAFYLKKVCKVLSVFCESPLFTAGEVASHLSLIILFFIFSFNASSPVFLTLIYILCFNSLIRAPSLHFPVSAKHFSLSFETSSFSLLFFKSQSSCCALADNSCEAHLMQESP